MLLKVLTRLTSQNLYFEKDPYLTEIFQQENADDNDSFLVMQLRL